MRKVRRAKRIRVRAYDLEGNLVEHDVDDLFSRAVQHETDHLDGKLFIDYLEPLALRIGRGEDPRIRAELPPGPAQRRDPAGRRPGAPARRDDPPAGRRSRRRRPGAANGIGASE